MTASTAPLKIAYQGTTDSFSHIACQSCFPEAEYLGNASFRDALAAVHGREADYALLPLENSVAGRIAEVYTLLPDMGLSIVGEYFMPIHLCLLMPTAAVKGLPKDNWSDAELVAWKNAPPAEEEISRAIGRIAEVYWFNVGLPPYEKFQREHLPHARQLISWDTAGAAQKVSRRRSPTTAVIASAATERYDMTVLRRNIEDDPKNTTRFLILARSPLTAEELPKGPAITTLVFKVPHVAGALVKALKVFEKHGVNMTKLETYMTGPHHSQPVFYVDIAASRYASPGKEVLEELEPATTEISVLGTYPASPLREETEGFVPVK